LKGELRVTAGGSDHSSHASVAFASFNSTDTAGAETTTWVDPLTTVLPDRSTETTYQLPDGSVLTSVTPPAGFDPLTADNSQLTQYGFPLPPSEAGELDAWKAAMSAFKSDEAPTEPLKVSESAPSADASFATYYTNWAGYIAGSLFVHSHTYVAVKANLTVPSNTGTCSSSNSVGFWIGLGGTNESNGLVQQGVECGNTYVGSGSAYRPFTEFASTAHPVAFCGFSSWTLAAGDVIYQNMSFQTSTNKAFFYLEDQTSGVTHSCSATPPVGWAWNLNVAEWIAESPPGFSINFHSVTFTNAHTELSSNSTWVTLGSQPISKTIQGSSSTTYCISPGAISGGTAFTDTWHSPGTCY